MGKLRDHAGIVEKAIVVGPRAYRPAAYDAERRRKDPGGAALWRARRLDAYWEGCARCRQTL